MVRASNVGRVLALLVLAAAGAAISNLAASTQRKLAWVGSYPRALQVEPAATEPTAAVAPPVTVPVASTPSTPSTPSTATTPTPPPSAAPAAASPAPAEGDLARSFPPHPDKPAVEIGPADVAHLYQGKALFLDARRSSVYSEGHIAGARNFPVWESDIGDRVKGLYEEGLDQKAPIVVYCSGGACEDSHMLAEKLYMVGFDNVLIYKDGFPDWEKRGLPTSKGAKP
ncbi:MAG TPA: rhodanese-like domain-containing protein [Thermoanaerobaculia bacterium]|jgi:rhodanese-related sulfurtransferase